MKVRISFEPTHVAGKIIKLSIRICAMLSQYHIYNISIDEVIVQKISQHKCNLNDQNRCAYAYMELFYRRFVRFSTLGPAVRI